MENSSCSELTPILYKTFSEKYTFSNSKITNRSKNIHKNITIKIFYFVLFFYNTYSELNLARGLNLVQSKPEIQE